MNEFLNRAYASSGELYQFLSTDLLALITDMAKELDRLKELHSADPVGQVSTEENHLMVHEGGRYAIARGLSHI